MVEQPASPETTEEVEMFTKSLIELAVEIAQLDIAIEKLDADGEEDAAELDVALRTYRKLNDEYVSRMTGLYRQEQDDEKGAYIDALTCDAVARKVNGPVKVKRDTPLAMTVNGYYDELYDEFIGSETQGPGCDIEDADEDDSAAFDFCQHFLLEDDALILHRWDRPEDDLEVLDLIAEQGLNAWNDEILLALRRRQLHIVCCAYFGTRDYMNREIVLKWHKNEAGKWMPAEKKTVGDWLVSLTHEFGEATLAGTYSALQTLRYKMRAKDKNAQYGPTRRVLTTEQVRTTVADAIGAAAEFAAHEADCTMQDAVDAFMELDALA